MKISTVGIILVVIFAFGWKCAGLQSFPQQNDTVEARFNEVTVFSAGDGGYNCFRIPALIATTKGTVLAFSEARKYNCKDWDEINIVMRRSLDGGAHWDPMRVLASDGANSVNQAAPVVDEGTGLIWLLFCQNNQRVFAIHSRDEGATWSKPREITRQVKDPNWHYLGTGHGIQLKSGRLLIPSWGDTSPGPVIWHPEPNWGKVQFSYAIYSDDHGASWHRGQPLDSDMSDECQVAEMADGTVYMNARSRQGKLHRAYAWSHDGGISWSNIRYDDSLPEPSCEGSLIRFTGPGLNEKNRVLLANPATTSERSHLTVRVSYDECQTWPVSKVLHEGTSGYSDMAVAPDKTILCLYDADRHAKTLLDRFNIQWLTNGKDRLARSDSSSLSRW